MPTMVKANGKKSSGGFCISLDLNLRPRSPPTSLTNGAKTVFQLLSHLLGDRLGKCCCEKKGDTIGSHIKYESSNFYFPEKVNQ